MRGAQRGLSAAWVLYLVVRLGLQEIPVVSDGHSAVSTSGFFPLTRACAGMSAVLIVSVGLWEKEPDMSLYV